MDLHLLVGPAGEEVQRRVVAQHLLHEGRGVGPGPRAVSSASFTALPSVCTVASWPAFRSRMQVVIISSVVSRAPSSSAAISAEIRSSRGSERRRST
jgi:hypothetical protein